MKNSKQRQGPDSGRSGDRSPTIGEIKRKRQQQSAPNWPLLAVIGVVTALFAWMFLRPQAPTRKVNGAQGEDGVESDERIDAIREALFSDDGRYNFGKDGDGAKRSGSRFSHADYWENRYTKSKADHYDWYGTWNSESKIRIRPHVLPWMPQKSKEATTILNVGCGNSRLSEELLNDGYTDIMSVDIAQSAIDKMSEKFKQTPLRFQQMDATKMTFKDESFDVVFDKGTLDAMYTGAADIVKLAVAEIFRVLRPGGTFVSLTFGHPNSRKDLNLTSGKVGELPGWEHSLIKKIHKEDESGLHETEKQAFWMYLFSKPA